MTSVAQGHVLILNKCPKKQIVVFHVEKIIFPFIVTANRCIFHSIRTLNYVIA